MEEVSEKVSFPSEEERILQYWDEIDAFKTAIKKSEGRPAYTFYDGPPFATGMPHYGHILAGTIKDTVTRYAHQTGHYVERKWGWDCHGLPVEYEVEQSEGIKGRDEILKLGIDKYNGMCRGIVMRYATAWKRVVRRLARWIDMENDYKTLDPSFMESVWWVFKQLFEKKLVYRGFKVMPYSTACGTCLSNFEANLNYKDISDPSVFVTFPIVGEESVSLMAWTTTPWTLPSNLALCVNPTFDYCRIQEKSSGKVFIIAQCRLAAMFKSPDLYTVISTCKGEHLVGLKYVPLFPFFAHLSAGDKGAFRVVMDNYVTEDSGTGIVHQAPAFGEDDLRVCVKNEIIQKGEQPVCPIDANGKFTDEVPPFASMYIKDADKVIIQAMKSSGRLYQAGALVHSYPFCWRSDTPLIYRIVPSWFVNVESFKDRIIEANKKTYWVPEFVQTRRFQNWLEDARDWAVSRDRFWGTPLPIWHSDDWEEIVCIGSIEELQTLSGVAVTDLHRESIDHITIPSKRGKGVLHRVEQVFDCWFESGSMPYAQQHYPFQNKQKFESSFPADFIAEGLDQTRGWFYTLMVLSTALFDRPPFQNVIVNGLVLAADGKKMSKRLKNYPDPELVIHKHGADALRLYLINSPAVRAESLRFREEGVQQIVKDVFLPWYNAYRFFQQCVKKYELEEATTFRSVSKNNFVTSSSIMDQWIQASCAALLEFVREEMSAYRLYTVVPRLVQFIEDLTNWYVRMNRPRLKGKGGSADALVALSTLFEVLLTLSIAMAPFTPFFAELLYQNLRKVLGDDAQEASVHFVLFPKPSQEALDSRMVTKMKRMQQLIERGRLVRDKQTLSLKLPMTSVTVIHSDPLYLADISDLKQYIQEELNVLNVHTVVDDGSVVKLSASAEMQLLGPRLGKDVREVKTAIAALTNDDLRKLMQTGEITCAGHVLKAEELKISRELLKGSSTGTVTESYDDVLVLFDCNITNEMQDMGTARDIISRIQKLRKRVGLQVHDDIDAFWEGPDCFQRIFSSRAEQFVSVLGAPPSNFALLPPYAVQIARETETIRVGGEDVRVTIVLTKSQLHVLPQAPEFGQHGAAFQTLANTLDFVRCKQMLQAGPMTLSIQGHTATCTLNKNIFLSVAQMPKK